MTKHVKDQNWFAVGLDFLIVVFGVFIGFQVTIWNQDRQNNDRAEAYLERIGGDLDADLVGYAERGVFWADVSDYGATALAYANTGNAKGASQWELLLAFFQAGQIGEFFTRDTTYEELKSAGELGLIDNTDLRNQLANYYTNADNPALSERPRYREHIRGLIHFDIQLYIWENCYRTTSGVNQDMFACDSPIDEARAAEILGGLVQNTTLIEELRFWMSTMHVASIMGRDRSEFARRIRKALDEEIGRAVAPQPLDVQD
ncbi:MAG: hypothetical protein PF630_09930 [Gammaproteobacteria bacterium]|nr:hypothetical protein [Gammaproteobacteria bacterium]